MNKVTRILALSLIGFSLATAVKANQLSVTISDIPDDRGTLMVRVDASEAAFNDKAPPTYNFLFPARVGEMTFNIGVIDAGVYGIRVMQDQNDNGEMDSNLVGIPKEPWGFSNDAAGNFGPPKWKAIKFSVDGDTNLTIHLNH